MILDNRNFVKKISISTKVPPDKLPVAVDEFKVFARIDTTREDVYLTSLLTGVTEVCEKYLGRALITRELLLSTNEIHQHSIELPYPILKEIVSIETRDSKGNHSVVPSGKYISIVDEIPARVVFQSIPDALEGGNYLIRYTCGYGDEPSDVPEAIKQSILTWANMAYENRVIQPDPPIEVRSSLSLYTVERM